MSPWGKKIFAAVVGSVPILIGIAGAIPALENSWIWILHENYLLYHVQQFKWYCLRRTVDMQNHKLTMKIPFLAFTLVISLLSTRFLPAVEPTKPTVMEFEDIKPEAGLLLTRAGYTYEMYRQYTPEHILTLNYSTEPSDHAFPGDTIGRFLTSATLLSRALHQPEPDNLKKVMAALPSMLNQEGYVGWVLPKDKADETGMANVQWSNGLTEYYLWTHDQAALQMNQNVFQNIILPVQEAFYYYYSSEKQDNKIQWVHCTGDTSQAFGIIDPATRGYPLFPSPALKAEIDELIRLYQKIDQVEIKAQIHSVLFTTRGILRWYELHGNPSHLQFAESLYKNYRQLAMTENYENYNWFGRPEWTEGCAIVDSLTVTLKLWQLTGKIEYLEDAHLILFNGLLANQQGDGGDFGINTCTGPNDNVFLQHKGAAPWCCSVWGGKGFARVMQYSQFLKEDGLIVTIFGNNTVTARLPDGTLTLRQTTAYPYEGNVRFEVLSSRSQQEQELLVSLPSWLIPETLTVMVNGRKIEPAIRDSFLSLRRSMQQGDQIEIRFGQSFRCAALLYPDRKPGYHRYLYGPLVLGLDSEKEQSLPKETAFEASGSGCYRAKSQNFTLVPVCDLMDGKNQDKRSATGSAQILFKD